MFTCTICSSTYTDKFALQNHAKRHKEETSECNYCDKSYLIASELRKHVLSYHEGAGSVQCHFCNTPFHKRYLKLHIKKKHDVSKPKLKCQLCDFLAWTKGDLNKHKKGVHEGLTYPCQQCDYKASFHDTMGYRAK